MTVEQARADVAAAASGWSDDAVRLLAALVRLGEPLALLARANTFAESQLAAVWRLLAHPKVSGVELPKPGDV